MNNRIPVTALPTAGWSDARPEALSPGLWAPTRPTPATHTALPLPAGEMTVDADGELLGWTSKPGTTDLSALWRTCAQRFPETGLWPLLDSDTPRPYRRWDLSLTDDGTPYWELPYLLPSNVFDTVNTPTRASYFWDDDAEREEFPELFEGLGLTWTEMKLAGASDLPPAPLARAVAPRAAESLTLVACRRPSDSVLMLDFGVANDCAPPGIFAGVLRSWEERFALVPESLAIPYTRFQLLAGPIDNENLNRLAVEVVCFAEDSAWQGGFNPGPVTELVRSQTWEIWWD